MATEIIIDDGTPDSIAMPGERGAGYQGMFKSAAEADALSMPFPRELLIPRSDWQGMCEEIEERKTGVSHLIVQQGLTCKNQKTTPLCWSFATVLLLEIWRLIQNQKLVRLSPGSVAGPITGFKYRGGWGQDALEQLIESGADESAFWPDTSLDKKLWTAESKARAFENRVTEWFRITPRNDDELISGLLRRMPFSCGYNWQGHQTAAIDPVWRNGQIGTRNMNSWSEDWPSPGAGGWYILQGKKMSADDAVAIRAATAS